MLDLRRLRLLHELRERGTIAAVADAPRFTPSALSQQLPPLEREARHDLHRDPLRVVLPETHELARRHPRTVPLRALAGATWTTGHPGMGWEEVTRRACRELGGFDPVVGHRTNDAVVSLGLVAHGLAVTLLPDFVAPAEHPGVAARAIGEGAVHRTIYAATRAADAQRPSVQA